MIYKYRKLILSTETEDNRIDLVPNATESIKHEIAMLVSSYKFEHAEVPIEDYHSNSTWLNV